MSEGLSAADSSHMLGMLKLQYGLGHSNEVAIMHVEAMEHQMHQLLRSGWSH